MQKDKSNYRRGGLFLFVASLSALLLAFIMQAPVTALASIAVFGLGGAVVLMLV